MRVLAVASHSLGGTQPLREVSIASTLQTGTGRRPVVEHHETAIR
jgi:hypothetical protein